MENYIQHFDRHVVFDLTSCLDHFYRISCWIVQRLARVGRVYRKEGSIWRVFVGLLVGFVLGGLIYYFI